LASNLFEKLKTLETEKQNPDTMGLDSMSIEEILRTINKQDKTVPFAVEKEIPYIAQAVGIVVKAMKKKLLWGRRA